MKEIKIQFPTERHALAFASWLSNSGEQDFYDTQQMLVDDGEIEDIVGFHYHGEEDETCSTSNPDRYGEFMEDWTIRTSIVD